MKVIDLLNKIANGEKINKFKYYGGTYIYDKETQKYFYEDMWFDLDFSNLNDEVEIIEEDKKIKRLPTNDGMVYATDGEMTLVVNKINEIIDKINSMEVK